MKKRTKKRKEWMAIVTVQLKGDDPKPIVIQDDDNPATYASIEDIEELASEHILGSEVWTAFNFTTGESVTI